MGANPRPVVPGRRECYRPRIRRQELIADSHYSIVRVQLLGSLAATPDMVPSLARSAKHGIVKPLGESRRLLSSMYLNNR